MKLMRKPVDAVNDVVNRPARNIAKGRGEDSYLQLVRRCPLRAVRTRADYDAAARMIDQLGVRDDLDAGERLYLDAIEVLMNAYEEAKFRMPADRRTPLQRLQSLVTSSETSASQLQAILGTSQSMVSMILCGERALSKKSILKLAAHFNLEPGYFL